MIKKEQYPYLNNIHIRKKTSAYACFQAYKHGNRPSKIPAMSNRKRGILSED